MMNLILPIVRGALPRFLLLGVASFAMSMFNGSAVFGKETPDGPEALVGHPAPELAFKAYGSNAPIDITDLRGKMVVVDFFTAERATDFTAFDDLLDAEQAYGRKGVVFIGVSMDENQTALVGLFQKKPNVDWPIDYDAMGFAGATSLRWKASRQTGTLRFASFWHVDYLVSPDGTVLWAGEPSELSKAIDDQIKDHKPQVVDTQVMADAKDAMDKMQSAIADNNIAEAYRQRTRIPKDALADDDFAASVKDADDKLQAAGDSALAEVDPLIANKDYTTAISKLKVLANGADGTPLGTKAKVKLVQLQHDPDARAALLQAQKNANADAALKVAQKLQADKRDVPAYNRYKFIARTFAGTPAADTATQAIATYDADPAFKKELAGQASAAPSDGDNASPSSSGTGAAKPDPARAKSLLSLADSYRDAGNTDKAKEKYQAVIDQFPGTPEADTAKDELAKLSQ